MANDRFVAPDHIRTMFSTALSQLYRSEVPRYGALLDLVSQVNEESCRSDSELREDAQRWAVERHGAIRLGTAAEMAIARRLFAAMGMQPVGYYDLSVAGLPVHATAFRPTELIALEKNPFRVFTSLLRPKLIEDAELRVSALRLLETRQIFTARCLQLIHIHEREGGLDALQAQEFVAEAMKTFCWHGQARVARKDYQAFMKAHPLIADIVCFPGPHLNHLTPRTLDIDAVHARMGEFGLQRKAMIEGPPRRAVPILLRQTSFMALSELVRFPDGADEAGTHTARFGEVEQRGCALTRYGRALYDKLIQEALLSGHGIEDRSDRLSAVFQHFPDDLRTLRADKLAYFHYRVADGRVSSRPNSSFGDLLDKGWIEAKPILYEDFLPISAAGIFRSNLRESTSGLSVGLPHQRALEEALGRPIADEHELYAELERRSRADCVRILGLPVAEAA